MILLKPLLSHEEDAGVFSEIFPRGVGKNSPN